MEWVNAEQVRENFRRYIQEYDGKVVTVDVLMEELNDAIDAADYQEMDD